MDRLQTMAVFTAVAEESGFAPAARKLNISAPSATRAVAELESRLGARLFHRTTRSVTLTDAGQRYLADCRRILSEIEDAERQASGVHAAPNGRVSVTASTLFGRIVVMPILLDLMDRYPEISLSTLFVDRIVHLMDEGIDVAVRIAHLPDSSLSAIRVGSMRRVLCASPDYLARHGMPVSPDDLARHETVDFLNESRGGGWTFDHGGTRLSMTPQSRLTANNGDAAIAAAMAGRGITRVLSYMIATPVADGALVTVLDDYAPPALPVHVVHKETGQISARVRAVVDHLADRLRLESVLQQSA